MWGGGGEGGGGGLGGKGGEGKEKRKRREKKEEKEIGEEEVLFLEEKGQSFAKLFCDRLREGVMFCSDVI